MEKKIIIFSGDPYSINSEIIYKSWKKLSKSTKRKIILISNFKLLQQQFHILKYSIKMKKIDNINQIDKSDKLKVLDINFKFDHAFKVKGKIVSGYVKKSLDYAHNLANKKNVLGIINCPINKNHLGRSNFGVTEYLAGKCKIKKNSEVMFIKSKKFGVVPVTTHINLRDVSKKINKKLILDKITSLNNNYKKLFKKKPKIGVLGINPHNSELSKNSEEKKIIIPSISQLKKRGINVTGPLVSDTVFIKEYEKYDVIVGMYHDQVLSPFKSIFKFDAINITLGLNYIRVSPDHGTAVHLIGKKKADASSLIKSIDFINKFGK